MTTTDPATGKRPPRHVPDLCQISDDTSTVLVVAEEPVGLPPTEALQLLNFLRDHEDELRAAADRLTLTVLWDNAYEVARDLIRQGIEVDQLRRVTGQDDVSIRITLADPAALRDYARTTGVEHVHAETLEPVDGRLRGLVRAGRMTEVTAQVRPGVVLVSYQSELEWVSGR